MVVVVARGHEQRAGISAHGHVESGRPGVEALGGVEVRDVEVDVADGRPLGHPARAVLLLGQQVGEVEGERVHLQLPIGVGPLRARPVAVDLDPVALGIAQVQGLADEVIGGAREPPVGGRDAAQRVGQRRAVGHQDRKMEEAGRPGGAGGRVGCRDELDQGLGTGAQACEVRASFQRPQAKHALVERGGALEVRDVEADGADPGILGQACLRRGHLRKP